MTPPRSPDLMDVEKRLKRLGFYDLMARLDQVREEPWLMPLIEREEAERQRRSLERRFRDAHIGALKPMADFDWKWPTKIDREMVDDVLSLEFLDEAANVVLVGPNGVGKSMIARNIAQLALTRGYTVRFTTASDMLRELAAQQSDVSLARRLGRYCNPQLLCVDEVGYLSYDSRYADLFYEVVNRRNQQRSIVLTTNKAFAEWTEVFPNASCVVTLIDRLVHRAEVIPIEGKSYRLKEATERAAAKAKIRAAKKRPPRA